MSHANRSTSYAKRTAKATDEEAPLPAGLCSSVVVKLFVLEDEEGGMRGDGLRLCLALQELIPYNK